jgi:NADPH:quinone reductase-like Zn-dependent oxidoreductase
MQAIIGERYGGPEVLVSREIGRPEIGERDVLVRVHAAGLHIGDVFGMRGSPFLVRFSSGLRRPKLGVPGFDIAGTVEATGPAVTRFVPGDEVFGICTWPSSGACAEYARAAEDALVRKPASMSFEQAAAIPTSASAALHGLRDAGRLQAGQRLLINGASGGVGTYAVQIARALGAEVTGVCGPTNVELVRSLGAHHVIDYTREDFTRGAARYDLILDNMENHSLADTRRALAPDGTLVLMSGTGASGPGLLVRLIRPVVMSPFVKHSLRRPFSNPNHEDLEVLVAMIEEGTVRPVIDSTRPLAETPAALRHIEAGHARGKVVVVIDGDGAGASTVSGAAAAPGEAAAAAAGAGR